MNRPDPYRERARELCLAAGLDPDSRVGDGRGMPAWCLYRDAARQEHLARETADAAADIASLRPQAEKFQSCRLKIFGRHDDATIKQMKNCMAVGNVVSGVICADGHLGYAQPVGGVIAYEGQISISGVGFDIGCGNMAARLDTPFTAIEDKVGDIIKDVARTISFGIGRSNEERVEHDLFDDGNAWREADMAAYRGKAAAQLGTVGSGNHYVDLMRDEDGLVWIGVHFGSRGLGHTSATRYLKAAGGKDGMNVPPALVDEDYELGRRSIAPMALAGRYAHAGGVSTAAAKSPAAPSPRACTTTTTTPGAKSTTARTFGWCARAPRRRFRASAALSAARWATTRGSSKASTANRRAPRSIPRSTAPAACSAARKPSAAFRAPRWIPGCATAAWRWSAPISTKARWRTGGSPKSSPNTPAP